jgi:hypothetical protein
MSLHSETIRQTSLLAESIAAGMVGSSWRESQRTAQAGGAKSFPFEQSLKLCEKCRCLVSLGLPKGFR